MLPLVTLQLTARSAVSPVLVKGMAVKAAAWFSCSVRSLGETASRDASLPCREGLVGILHATTVVMASARARRRVVRERIETLLNGLRRLDWRSTRTACGSLVALRPRLSPGLPLSRSPWRGGPSCRVNGKGRQVTRRRLEALAAGLTWRPLVTEVP